MADKIGKLGKKAQTKALGGNAFQELKETKSLFSKQPKKKESVLKKTYKGFHLSKSGLGYKKKFKIGERPAVLRIRGPLYKGKALGVVFKIDF